MKNQQGPPQHPGAVLRASTLPGLGLNISQAAMELKIARQTLHRVLAGQAAVTPDMALRIARLSSTRAEFWLDLQQKHDLWRLQRSLAPLLATIPRYPSTSGGSTSDRNHA